MTRARRYALTSSGVAVAAAAIGLPWIPERWSQGVTWAFYGWALAAIVGIVTGTWLARAHGRPGPGVLAALVSGILARMVLVAAGFFVAVRDGRGSAWGF